MDVKTYHIATRQCDQKNKYEYDSLEDRIEILEDSVAKTKRVFHDSFNNTQYVDTIKTTATIEHGTIKMPGYNKTKVAYDFDDFYEVDFGESDSIDIYREKVVIRENALEGLLVTKWQDIPKSTELDVSLIYDVASRIRNSTLFIEKSDLVYLYSDDYDDYSYIFKLEHTRSDTGRLTPKLSVQKMDIRGIIASKEYYPLGDNVKNSTDEFIPVSGLSVTRSYNGDLLLGFTVRNTKAIYGYGNRGTTYYNSDSPYSLSYRYGYWSSGARGWYSRSSTDSVFTAQATGNAGVYCTMKLDENLNNVDFKYNVTNPHKQFYDHYYDYSSSRSTGTVGHVGLEVYGNPMYVESNRNGVVTTCRSYPKTRYYTTNSSGNGRLHQDDSWGDYYSFKSQYESNTGNKPYDSTLFNYQDITSVSNIKDTYSFAHDGVIYSLLINYNTDTITYNSLLKTASSNSVFEKDFLLSKPFSTRKSTISTFKYIRSSGKLLSVVGGSTTDSNNTIILELHDIDELSRTIASTGEENNVKQVVDFEDRYGILISSHFTKYGHTGSYFAFHEDHKNNMLHLVFPGRKVGESTSVCRLYHMNFDLETLRPIGSPGEITMTVTTQSDMYNFQNVSICNNGKDLWVSYMFSDGRDHSDTYIVKVERFIAYIENRLQTDKGHNIRIDGFTQSFTFDEPISKVRFTSYMDNRIGVTHHETTNVDHIEFVHNGSKDQNSDFYFESELIPLNVDNGRVIFHIEQDEKDGKIDWFVSIDKGETWEPYVPGSWYRFYTNNERCIKLKAILSKGNAEYNATFKTPFIRSYTMRVDGGVLQNDIVNLQINLMKTNFKLDTFANASKNGLSRMSVDVFNDDSNIDVTRSDYEFDSKLKHVGGKVVITKPEVINSTMNNILLVVDEIDVDIYGNTITYYVSRDSGKSFIKILPNVLTSIPKDGANDSIDNELVFKAEFTGKSKLTAWSWSWD